SKTGHVFGFDNTLSPLRFEELTPHLHTIADIIDELSGNPSERWSETERSGKCVSWTAGWKGPAACSMRHWLAWFARRTTTTSPSRRFSIVPMSVDQRSTRTSTTRTSCL